MSVLTSRSKIGEYLLKIQDRCTREKEKFCERCSRVIYSHARFSNQSILWTGPWSVRVFFHLSTSSSRLSALLCSLFLFSFFMCVCCITFLRRRHRRRFVVASLLLSMFFFGCMVIFINTFQLFSFWLHSSLSMLKGYALGSDGVIFIFAADLIETENCSERFRVQELKATWLENKISAHTHTHAINSISINLEFFVSLGNL